jgi:ring-1,2-phenylacetyl-CoA epoxidase subunit PaaC
LVEQPNQDFAHTIVRQFLFDSFNFYFYQELLQSSDTHLAAIAEKSIKEVTYHLRYSSEWMIRLGDGTEESHERMQIALDKLWSFSEEALIADELDQKMLDAGIGVDLSKIKSLVEQKRKAIISEATLTLPEDSWMQSGGKNGQHTEHLGYILAEMQYLQRAYPGMEW